MNGFLLVCIALLMTMKDKFNGDLLMKWVKT